MTSSNLVGGSIGMSAASVPPVSAGLSANPNPSTGLTLGAEVVRLNRCLCGDAFHALALRRATGFRTISRYLRKSTPWDEAECNGVAERFMRTLKEQCIYLHQFQSLEEARRIIGEFIARYNAEWLIERLGHRTPAQARAEALARAA